MQPKLFSKGFLVALFESGDWYTRLAWVLIVILWLSFVMFLVDYTAY